MHITDTDIIELSKHRSRYHILDQVQNMFTPDLWKKDKKLFNQWAHILLERMLDPNDNKTYISTYTEEIDTDFFKTAAGVLIHIAHVSNFKCRKIEDRIEDFTKKQYLFQTDIAKNNKDVRAKLLGFVSAFTLLAECENGGIRTLWDTCDFAELVQYLPEIIEEIQYNPAYILDYAMQGFIKSVYWYVKEHDINEKDMLPISYVLTLRHVDFHGTYPDTMKMDFIEHAASKYFKVEAIRSLVQVSEMAGTLGDYKCWQMLNNKDHAIESVALPCEI